MTTPNAITRVSTTPVTYDGYKGSVSALKEFFVKNGLKELHIGDYTIKLENGNLVVYNKDGSKSNKTVNTVLNEVFGPDRGLHGTPWRIIQRVKQLIRQNGENTLKNKIVSFSLNTRRAADIDNYTIEVIRKRTTEADGQRVSALKDLLDLKGRCEVILQKAASTGLTRSEIEELREKTGKLESLVKCIKEINTGGKASTLDENTGKSLNDTLAQTTALIQKAGTEIPKAETALGAKLDQERTNYLAGLIKTASLQDLLSYLDPKDDLIGENATITVDQLKSLLNDKAVSGAIADRLLYFILERPSEITESTLKPFLKLPDIRRSLGKTALEWLKNSPHTIKPHVLKLLLPVMSHHLPSDQRIIGFDHKGATYYVIAKRAPDGKHQTVGGYTPEKALFNYQLETTRGGEITVRIKTAWNKPDIIIKHKELTVVKPTDMPLDAAPGERIVKIGAYIIKWKDDGDGAISRSEAKSARIYRVGQAGPILIAKGISENLFGLIDKNMDADVKFDADSPDKITKGEMEVMASTIAAYAKYTGLSYEKAFDVYNTSTSFRMVDVEEMRGAHGEISGNIRGILGLKTDSAVKDLLTDSKRLGLSARIAELVLKYINDNKGKLTESAVAGYILRMAEASKFDQATRESIFGIKGDYFTKAFTPKKYSRENILLWLQGQEDSANGVDDENGSSSGASKSTLDEIRKAKSPAQKESLALGYIRKQTDPQKILDFLAKLSKKGTKLYVEGIADHRDVLGTLFNAYISQENLEEAFNYAKKLHDNSLYSKIVTAAIKSGKLKDLELAYSVAKQIKADETRWQDMVKISQKYAELRGAESNGTEHRQKALAIAEEILTQVQADPTKKGNWSFQAGDNRQVTIQEYIRQLEQTLKTPTRFLDHRDNVLKGGILTNDSALIKTTLEELKTIVENDQETDQETDLNKAFAYRLRAQILAARAARFGNQRDFKNEIAFYNRSIYAFRKAYEQFIKLSNDPKTQAKDQVIFGNIAAGIVERMVDNGGKLKDRLQVKGIKLASVFYDKNNGKAGKELKLSNKKKSKISAKQAIEYTLRLIPQDCSVQNPHAARGTTIVVRELVDAWLKKRSGGGGGGNKPAVFDTTG